MSSLLLSSSQELEYWIQPLLWKPPTRHLQTHKSSVRRPGYGFPKKVAPSMFVFLQSLTCQNTEDHAHGHVWRSSTNSWRHLLPSVLLLSFSSISPIRSLSVRCVAGKSTFRTTGLQTKFRGTFGVCSICKPLIFRTMLLWVLSCRQSAI
jgi:hypothetical protein